MSTEKLVLELEAKTGSLMKDLKKVENSLEDVESESKKADKSLNLLSSAFKTAAASAAAGATALVTYANVVGRAVRETEVMADVAGLSVEEFNALDYTMGRVGISAEKFGDITKDTREKLGELTIELRKTGGIAGGFDVFLDAMQYTEEQVKSVAESMTEMSGDQVLQFMVDEMQKAGVTTQEMSAALESVASDSTRLIPLLKDQGAQINALIEEYKNLNSELSEEERQSFVDFANNMDGVTTAFKGFLNNAISPFIPAMNDAAVAVRDFFAEWSNELDLDQLEERIKNDLTGLIASDETMEDLQNRSERIKELIESNNQEIDSLVEKSMAARERGTSSSSSVADALDREAKRLIEENDIIEEALVRYNELIENYVEPEEETNSKRIELVEDRIETVEELEIQHLEKMKEIKDAAAAEDKDRIESKKQDWSDLFEVIEQEADLYDKNEAARQKNQDAAIGGLKNLVGATENSSKTMFKISKGMKIAEAIQNTYSSATGAYNAMASIPVVGPALGAAAAAAAIAAGMANVNAIRSTSFSGGGGGGGAPASPSFPNASGGGGRAEQAAERNNFIEIRGLEANQLYSGAQVEELVGVIREVVSTDDGVINSIAIGQMQGAREGAI